MEFCPYDIAIHPKIEKKSKIPRIVIDRAARKIANRIHQKDPNPELYKKYNITIDIEGMRMFITFEFQYNNVFHVCNAKPASGRKKR